jgi:outer membrane protein TolC
MLFLFLFFVLLLPAIVVAKNPAPTQLRMHDAVQQALKHNPNLQALRYAVQAYKSEAKSEKSGYLPTLDAASNISWSKGEKELDSDTQIIAGQLIYSGAGPLQKYQRAKNVTAVSELERIVQVNATRRETEKSFLRAWLVQEKEKAILALTTSAQKTFKRQEHKNKLEKLDKDEWLNDVTACATSITQLDQYGDDVRIAYRKLEFLMGESLSLLPTSNGAGDLTPAHTQLVWHYKKRHRLKSLETYYHDALISRPEVPQGLKKIAIEKWNIRLAQGQRLPVINFNANVGCATNPNDKTFTYIPTVGDPEIAPPSQSAIVPYWSMGVSLNWSIFDGLVQQYRAQRAEADKIKEMLMQEQVILDIKQQVHDGYYSLVKTLKQGREEQAKYLQGSNHFKLMKQYLDLGRIAQVDFDAAYTTWQNIQLDWLSYHVRIALAKRDLMWACGYPKKP